MIIKNIKQLSQTRQRQEALDILEKGLRAINPSCMFKEKIKRKAQFLTIQSNLNQTLKWNLDHYKNIYVIGFGKASGAMAKALEVILGDKVTEGLVIDIKAKKLNKIKVKKGSHPLVSKRNLYLTRRILKLAQKAEKDDLVFCLISGGGSALLEKPICSLERLAAIHNKLLKSNASISEINTVRKHLSHIKGGKLAQILYPANIVNLFVSDVPGNQLDIIASGPTLPDQTTIQKAQIILKKYKIPKIKLTETFKDPEIFKKTKNVLLLTNEDALKAMLDRALKLGYKTEILDSNLNIEARDTAFQIFKKLEKMPPRSILLAGGEVKIKVKNQGRGGRNTHLTLEALNLIKNGELFIALASDGLDNSNAAGAIADNLTLEKAHKLKIKPKIYLDRFNSYTFFQKTDDLIFTGPTESNVADLILTLKK